MIRLSLIRQGRGVVDVALCLLLAIAAFVPRATWASGPTDESSGTAVLGCVDEGELFNSGFEAGLTIVGRTTIPVVLKGATVTAAFGERCVTDVSGLDGGYAFSREHRS